MARLTKEQILQATDVDRGEVEVPEWGGSVLVSALDAQTVQHLISSGFVILDGDKSSVDLTKMDLVDIAWRGMVDDDGDRLFTKNEVKKLDQKSWQAVFRIVVKIMQLSGFATEGEEEGEEKNE